MSNMMALLLSNKAFVKNNQYGKTNQGTAQKEYVLDPYKMFLCFIHAGLNQYPFDFKWDVILLSYHACISNNLVVYYCKCCNLIGYATRYLFVNRYREATSNATRPSFSQKNRLFLVFRNNFEGITNTSLFLLKQFDYSLSISMKRQLTPVSPSLTITT